MPKIDIVGRVAQLVERVISKSSVAARLWRAKAYLTRSLVRFLTRPASLLRSVPFSILQWKRWKYRKRSSMDVEKDGGGGQDGA